MSGIAAALDHALLEDGSLRLRADAATATQVGYWLPRLPGGVGEPVAAGGWIEVRVGDDVAPRPAAGPTMALDPVEAWIEGGDAVTLRARGGSVSGTVDFARLEAELVLTPDAARPIATEHEPRNAAVFSALTLASGLLLNRMRRALLHAAAIVAPDGRAWLLVGDAFAGKTTTTVNVIRSGWDWISDDTVVLGRGEDGAVVVEGWPRAFHLDRGYHAGASVGERDTVEPDTFGPGNWRRSARLAGVLFPQVEADLPTTATPIPAADALARLIRQSPWLLADRTVARDVLTLLTTAVSGPRFHLRLGNDCYRDTERLLEVLGGAIGA